MIAKCFDFIFSPPRKKSVLPLPNYIAGDSVTLSKNVTFLLLLASSTIYNYHLILWTENVLYVNWWSHMRQCSFYSVV